AEPQRSPVNVPEFFVSTANASPDKKPVKSLLLAHKKGSKESIYAENKSISHILRSQGDASTPVFYTPLPLSRLSFSPNKV
ncbi:MAG TPA: hypothetical protein DIC24_04400, partial [Gammaproteobacteria bacterium]|nr:hypothetical protein [Gammaproteobacteria bacterium]